MLRPKSTWEVLNAHKIKSARVAVIASKGVSATTAAITKNKHGKAESSETLDVEVDTSAEKFIALPLEWFSHKPCVNKVMAESNLYSDYAKDELSDCLCLEVFYLAKENAMLQEYKGFIIERLFIYYMNTETLLVIQPPQQSRLALTGA
ncbi:hypothetical protein A0J61_06052 [Choanephora cucurbitarum]|uniref:Uncharacterized protein n=1 Tax=Choanephora cucurbitarum TaxID=101091 RepID=A0A1C7N9U3_9FUNG|nr:hypothetical protein A0J61_06052 [Choanephora cucurbitarum]